MKRIFFLFTIVSLVMITACVGPGSAARLSMEPGEGAHHFEFETAHTPANAIMLVDEWIQMHARDGFHPTTKNPDMGRLVFRSIMHCPVALTQLPFDYTCEVTVKDGLISFDYQVGKMSSGMGYPPVDAMNTIRVQMTVQAVDISEYVDSVNP